jgi:hypothetical protein
MIDSIVTNVVRNEPTPLQLALSVVLNPHKSLINTFHDYGVTCTYYELRRFRASAAATTATTYQKTAEEGLIQVKAIISTQVLPAKTVFCQRMDLQW